MTSLVTLLMNRQLFPFPLGLRKKELVSTKDHLFVHVRDSSWFFFVVLIADTIAGFVF